MAGNGKGAGLVIAGLAGAAALLAAGQAAEAKPPGQEPAGPEVPDMDITELVNQMRSFNSAAGEIKDLLRDLRRIQVAGSLLEQRGYLARKQRAGEAVSIRGAYFQLIVGGGTFAFQVTNPEGYVCIDQWDFVRVSQPGVIELIILHDDQTLVSPFLWVPRLTDFEFSYTLNAPFENVIKNAANLTYINWDPLPQWIGAAFVSTFIRKDVWEKDSALMDSIARQYEEEERP